MFKQLIPHYAEIQEEKLRVDRYSNDLDKGFFKDKFVCGNYSFDNGNKYYDENKTFHLDSLNYKNKIDSENSYHFAKCLE